MNYQYTQILLITIFAVVLLFFLFGKSKAKPKDKYHWLIVAVLVAISATRSPFMADYMDYVMFFTDTGETRFEPGFRVIRWFAQLTSFPEIAGILIAAIIAVPIRLLYVLKYSPFYWASLAVYLSYVFILHDMITIRAGVASALLLFIIYYHNQKKYRLSILLYIVAVLFHQSAAIFGIVFLFREKENYRLAYISLIIISYSLALLGFKFGNIIGLVTVESVSSLYESFSESNYDSANIFNLVQLGHLMVCLAGWCAITKIREIDIKAVAMLKLYTISIAIIPLFSDFLVIAFRFSQILQAVEVILVPIIFYSLFNNKRLSKIIILAYVLVLFYIGINDDGWWLAMD